MSRLVAAILALALAACAADGSDAPRARMDGAYTTFMGGYTRH